MTKEAVVYKHPWDNGANIFIKVSNSGEVEVESSYEKALPRSPDFYRWLADCIEESKRAAASEFPERESPF